MATMRMRVAVVAAVATMLLAGCTPVAVPLQRAAVPELVIPTELGWRYASSCTGDDVGGGGIITFQYGNGGSNVTFAEDTPESRAEAERIEACLDEYRYDESDDQLDYVDGYERSQLWTYYTAVTAPCLAARGIQLDPIPREEFFVPDQRPWNPFTAMDDVPIADLLALYRECPPIPAFLREPAGA
jgi:hypothetical protein